VIHGAGWPGFRARTIPPAPGQPALFIGFLNRESIWVELHGGNFSRKKRKNRNDQPFERMERGSSGIALSKSKIGSDLFLRPLAPFCG